MKSGICDNIILLLGLESKITGGRFDDCELVDRCNRVAAGDPCDHLVGSIVGQVQVEAVISVGFVLVDDPFGMVLGSIWSCFEFQRIN